ncbi:MAG: zf-TFIIB domain-containing protein [Candidatus Omnitrophota bacterium]
MIGFRPDQWVRFENEAAVRRAYEDKDLLAFFNQDKNTQHCCPVCHAVLQKIVYEGAAILKCSYCQGVFVEYQKISRILIRSDKVFDDKIRRLAEMTVEQKKNLYVGPDGHKKKNSWIFTCPNCARKMHRQFFVYSYPIEIDRCPYCGGVWFDKTELEILQYLYEHKEKFFDGANF